MMPVSHTPDAVAQRRQLVRKRTMQGRTPAAIAAELGVTVRTVERIRTALGVAAPAPVPLTAAQHQRIAELLEDGASMHEAARTVGCSPETVVHHYKGMSRYEPLGIRYLRLARQLGLGLSS